MGANSVLTAGQRLGKYLVTGKLGEGGMGVVYAGVHEALGRDVAIKLLRAEYARTEMLLSRFMAEAQAVSRIGHANIVAVYDFGQLDDGSLYYVMERIQGEALSARIARQPPLGRDEVVDLFAQTCRALAATHAQNIVHRDLKPDNVLLHQRSDGRAHVKVLDFGIAKIRGEDQTPKNLTRTGVLMGTPTYMAPEQITHCNTVDARADIYSLGAMLYEVLTGAPPFDGDAMVVLAKHVTDMPPPPSKRTSTPIPPALDAMVLRALAKEPEARQPDAATFAAQLEAAWPGAPRPQPRPMPVSAPNPIVIAPRPRPIAPRTVAPEPASPAAGAPAMATQPPQTGAPAAPSSRRATMLIVVAIAGLGAAAAAIAATRRSPAPPLAAPQKPAAHSQKLRAALAGAVLERRSALEAIGETLDRKARPSLLAALADENPEVRRAAAVAAGQVGSADDVELRRAVNEAAQRSGGSTAIELLTADVRLGDATAGGLLTRSIGSAAIDPIARLRALVTLSERQRVPARQLHAAIAAATTAGRALHWASYVALYNLGDDADFADEIERALKAGDETERLDAAQTVARVGISDGKTVLQGLSRSARSAEIRVDAAIVLAGLGEADSFAGVRAGADSPTAAVRSRAAAALARQHAHDPAPADSRRALSKLLDDGDRDVALTAAAALEAID